MMQATKKKKKTKKKPGKAPTPSKRKTEQKGCYSQKDKDKVLKMYKAGRTQQEIADTIGCSQATVCIWIGDPDKKILRNYNKRNRNQTVEVEALAIFAFAENSFLKLISKAAKNRQYEKVKFYMQKIAVIKDELGIEK